MFQVPHNARNYRIYYVCALHECSALTNLAEKFQKYNNF
jgi:hypothetical protein